jgi:flavin reductase (DIM6/NTAB) family NADH-FMN oxidoreductase RutF
VVTAVEPGGAPVGMAVGSFTSVSLHPPLVAFFPDRGSTSWPRIERAGRFCVNVLGAHQQDICSRFASKAEDKFAGLVHAMTAGGSPVIDDVVAWIDCDLHAVHEAGDHYIVLGRVNALDVVRADQPLLFFRGAYGQFTPLSGAD